MSTLAVEERFAIAPEWVLDHPGLSDRAVRLYLVLRTFADNVTGVAWPGRRRLAERLRCDVKTIDRALAELAKAGAVTVRARFDDDHGQRSNAYVVRTSRPGSTPLVTNDQGGSQPRPGLSPAVTRAPGQPCPPELDPGELEGGSHRARAGDTPSPTPKIDSTHGGRHAPGNPDDRPCHRCRDEKDQAAADAAERAKQRERDAAAAARAAAAASLAATTALPRGDLRQRARQAREEAAASRSVPLSGTSDG